MNKTEFDANYKKAQEIYESGKYTCVICCGEKVFLRSKSGISPLIEAINDKEDLSGGSAFDKIVGRAAALLYVKLGVSALHADVISEGGAEILRKHGILFTHDVICKEIINRQGSGICPMEEAVLHTESPDEAMRLISEKLIFLKERR